MADTTVVEWLGLVALTLSIVVSAWMVRRQMRMSYMLALRTKALSYSLYANEHLRDARLKLEMEYGSLFKRRGAIPIDEIEEKTEEDPELLSAIMTILAHWENMALAIHSGIADERVCRDMVSGTLVQHVKVFRDFIEERRSTNPNAYDNLLSLCGEWSKEMGLAPAQSPYDPPL